MGCRKGCRYCRYRYFECCDFCNILGLTPESELLPLIVIVNFGAGIGDLTDSGIYSVFKACLKK